MGRVGAGPFSLLLRTPYKHGNEDQGPFQINGLDEALEVFRPVEKDIGSHDHIGLDTIWDEGIRLGNQEPLELDPIARGVHFMRQNGIGIDFRRGDL